MTRNFHSFVLLRGVVHHAPSIVLCPAHHDTGADRGHEPAVAVAGSVVGSGPKIDLVGVFAFLRHLWLQLLIRLEIPVHGLLLRQGPVGLPSPAVIHDIDEHARRCVNAIVDAFEVFVKESQLLPSQLIHVLALVSKLFAIGLDDLAVVESRRHEEFRRIILP